MGRSAAVLVALLSACAREAPLPEEAAQRPLVRRLEADVNTLNYLLQSTEDERQVLDYLYDPLIALDEHLAPVPGLARAWEVTDGGRAYTFHLDPRATFSDGMAVHARDVLFTISKAVAESPQFASRFDGFDRTQSRVIDAHTVRLVFRTAHAGRLVAFNLGVVPGHIYGTGKLGAIERVVSSGPYTLASRAPGRIVLTRREDYWRAKPAIQQLVFRVIADGTVAWNALLRGDVDVSRVDNDVWKREKDNPGVQRTLAFHTAWLLSYNCVIWNLADPLFADRRVRTALAKAFDRQAVIDALYHGQARAVTGPFTPDQAAYNARVPQIAFDLPGAARLLAAAGWRDRDGDGTLDREGTRFAFTATIPAGNAAMRDQAQIYQASLRSIGIAMEISAMDGAAYFDRVMQKNFQAAFIAWFNDPDPDPYSVFHSSQQPPAGVNVGSYANPVVDRLLEQARSELDPVRRVALYHQIHAQIAQDQPYLFTVQVATKWAVNRRATDVRVANGVGLFLWRPGPLAWRLAQ